jgi:hypothetical protein
MTLLPKKYANPFNSISFMPAVATTSSRLRCELVVQVLRAFYFCRLIVKLHADRFFTASGVGMCNTTRTNDFRFRHAAFCSQLKSKVGNRDPRQDHSSTYQP